MQPVAIDPGTVAREADDRLIHETSSLCRICKNGVAARVVRRSDGTVWMRKKCERHGRQDIQIGTNADWYERTRQIKNEKIKPLRVLREVEHGCPFDCGACGQHLQKVRLPVLPI